MLFIVILPGPILSQPSSPHRLPYLNLGHWSYPLIRYQLVSNQTDLFPLLLQPYGIDKIVETLPGIRNGRWRDLLEGEFSRFRFRSDSLDSGLSFKLFGGEKLSLTRKNSRGRYFVSGEAYWSLPSLVIANRTVVDESFSDDLLYAGTTRKWTTARIEDAYVLGEFRSLKYSFGRLTRNWGLPSQFGFLLSNHSFSYDHLSVELHTRHFNYSFFTSRLDNVIARVQDAPDTSIAANKYITAHRLDVAIGEKLQIGISESVIYGGPNRDFEFAYLNPVGFYFESQLNLDLEANGFWSIDAFYKPTNRATFYGQFLFDDIIINDEPDKDFRSQFPDRVGYSVNSMFADLLASGTLLDLNYTRVSNWTYQSARTWENYLYKGKSLGFPFNGFESFRFSLSHFGVPPFIFGLNYQFSRKGKQNLDDVFFPIQRKFPAGVVEKSHSIELSCFYIPKKELYLDARLSWQGIENDQNIDGKDLTGFSLFLNLFASIDWIWQY